MKRRSFLLLAPLYFAFATTVPADLERLRSEVTLPAILNVRLDRKVDRRDSRYSTKWGWNVGVPHAVVVFGFTDDDRVNVGDPGVGREYWSVQALRDLWHGDYVTLEKDK